MTTRQWATDARAVLEALPEGQVRTALSLLVDGVVDRSPDRSPPSSALSHISGNLASSGANGARFPEMCGCRARAGDKRQA